MQHRTRGSHDIISKVIFYVFPQKSLDDTAGETAQRQDEAEKGKKQLIELTKEWRKKNDEVYIFHYCPGRIRK